MSFCGGCFNKDPSERKLSGEKKGKRPDHNELHSKVLSLLLLLSLFLTGKHQQ